MSLCARGGRGVTMMLSDACARALLEREEDLGKGARGTDEWGAEGEADEAARRASAAWTDGRAALVLVVAVEAEEDLGSLLMAVLRAAAAITEARNEEDSGEGPWRDAVSGSELPHRRASSAPTALPHRPPPKSPSEEAAAALAGDAAIEVDLGKADPRLGVGSCEWASECACVGIPAGDGRGERGGQRPSVVPLSYGASAADMDAEGAAVPPRGG